MVSSVSDCMLPQPTRTDVNPSEAPTHPILRNVILSIWLLVPSVARPTLGVPWALRRPVTRVLRFRGSSPADFKSSNHAYFLLQCIYVKSARYVAPVRGHVVALASPVVPPTTQSRRLPRADHELWGLWPPRRWR